MNTSKAFYRVHEACEMLALGKTQLYRLIAAKKLPVVKIGRSTRIAASAIEEFILEAVATGTALSNNAEGGR